MAAIRRHALIALALAGCGPAAGQQAAALPAPVPSGSPPLALVNGPAPGALTLIAGAAGAMVERRLGVEARTAAGWAPITTEFAVVAACAPPAPATPLVLAAGARFAVVPWRGFSCSGQCNTICRANIYYGRGPFRFVATLAGGARVVGPTFTMPDQPPR